MQLPNELLLDRAELRLEQIAMEDKYSRTNLREFIIKDIGCEMDVLQEDLAKALEKFANTTYEYDSKNIRMAQLLKVKPRYPRPKRRSSGFISNPKILKRPRLPWMP